MPTDRLRARTPDRRGRPRAGWRSSVLAEGDRVALCLVRAADGPEFLAAVARSDRLHGQWVYPPAGPASFRSYLARIGRGEDTGFLVRRLDTGEAAGFINLNNVVRGALQSADLGYAAFSPHQGKGFTAEGLRLVFSYSFGVLGLHRLQASIQPRNRRSVALARACGMVLEGYSPRYLFIGGSWRDHEHWVITAEEWS